MGAKGHREASDTLGGRTASSGAPRYQATSQEALTPESPTSPSAE